MKMNCLLCGVGGQGVVLSSKLIAHAAMNKSMNVKTTETIGMAQRGGCVASHVRISDSEIHSPLVPLGSADIILAFEPAEAVRALPFLKENGTVITAVNPVIPVNESLAKDGYDGSEALSYLRSRVNFLTEVNTDSVCSELGTTKVVNVVLLGAALKTIGFSLDEMEKTICEYLPEKFHGINKKALRAGAQIRK